MVVPPHEILFHLGYIQNVLQRTSSEIFCRHIRGTLIHTMKSFPALSKHTSIEAKVQFPNRA